MLVTTAPVALAGVGTGLGVAPAAFVGVGDGVIVAILNCCSEWMQIFQTRRSRVRKARGLENFFIASKESVTIVHLFRMAGEALAVSIILFHAKKWNGSKIAIKRYSNSYEEPGENGPKQATSRRPF